jgi:hypothetical protein
MINKVNGNGISRAVFDYISENQGVLVSTVVSDLVDCGYKRTSISSLVSQMVAKGLVERTVDGYLWPLAKEYRSLWSVKRKSKRKPAKKVPVLVYEKEMMVEPVTEVRTTAKQVMESMSVKEAHALYVELRSMFGEK